MIGSSRKLSADDAKIITRNQFSKFSIEGLVFLSQFCMIASLLNGPLAQSVEQWTFNPLVEGSSPSRPTTSGPAYDAGFLFPW